MRVKSVVCMVKIRQADGLLEQQAVALPCLALLSYLDSRGSMFLQNVGKFVPLYRVLSSPVPTLFIYTDVMTSNFPSLRSRSLHSNTKSNAKKRLKILTSKYPRFSLDTRYIRIFIILLIELFKHFLFGITLYFKIIRGVS
jgi:hypothetical protein